MTTTTAPIVHEIVSFLAARGLEPGADFSIRPNAWAGVDLTDSEDHVVRLTVDDDQVHLHVLEGRAQLVAASASFTGIPAGTVALTVAAFLVSSAWSRPAPTPIRAGARSVGPCPCSCNSGGFCGGCGHAGCGGRR